MGPAGVLLALVVGCASAGVGVPTVAPGASPSGVETSPPAPTSAESASVRVWVAVESADRVKLVDVAARDVLERYRARGGPHNITVAENGTVAVCLWGSDSVGIVREGRMRLVRLGGAPHDVKATGRMFVVANQRAARLDLVSVRGRKLGRIRLATDPHDLAINPPGGRAWVTLENRDELAVVDLDRRKVMRYVSTGRSPHDLLFAPDGRLWVTDWEGALHVFDGARRVKSIPLGVEAHHLAFTDDGRFAWITDHGAGKVFVLSVRRVKVVKSLRFPGEPHHVAIAGRWAVVADHANARVILYNATRMRRVGRVRVGAGPHGVWTSPTE
jgi:DNA-binding beta-propeller fold protein YncE